MGAEKEARTLADLSEKLKPDTVIAHIRGSNVSAVSQLREDGVLANITSSVMSSSISKKECSVVALT